MTCRLALANIAGFMVDAIARQPDDIKVVVQFADA